ncbi:MAG: NUDIX domain-containing protein [Thermoguttaceae bacterium]
MNLSELVSQWRSSIPDPRVGLPEDVFLFVSSVTPLVNVDLLIQDEAGRTLLTWREDGLYPPSWHVPGGIVRYQEKMADRVVAVAEDELGVKIRFQPEPLAVNEVICPEQKVRGHFISFLFTCKLQSPLDESQRHDPTSRRPGTWAWHDACPGDLISVHEIYRKFFRRGVL